MKNSMQAYKADVEFDKHYRLLERTENQLMHDVAKKVDDNIKSGKSRVQTTHFPSLSL